MAEATRDSMGRYSKGTPHPDVKYWLDEISAARKREKDYRKDGQRILDIYSSKKKDVPFNILFSNTSVLMPALYSAQPRPLVQRRFKDADPLGKVAAQAGQRLLEFLIDTNEEGYETYDEAMRMTTLDGLLPGRGHVCVQYDAEIAVVKEQEVKASELVCLDARHWKRVLYGYAKKWSKVPWIAYEEHMDEAECAELFGKGIASKIIYTEGEQKSDRSEDTEPGDKDERYTGERKTALIYQIWDKDGGRVIRYISPQFLEGALKVEDDPLQLTGFFNCPRPVQFIALANDLMPVPLYKLYENQAEELNKIQRRINLIVDACKARGIYDTELGNDIKKLFDAADNELIPADKSSSLAAEKGLQNAIWFAPLDVIVLVLEKLYLAREQCKQVIYEITGISDIIRGATKASETFGAQELKSQWGTLRLKDLQKEVQRYARDLLRIMLEIAATKFSEDTWAKMTGLPYLTAMQAQQLQAIAAAGDPQAQQQLQSTPTWAAVLKLLQDDQMRAYRIDIETNSTVELEAVEDKKDMTELLTTMGQVLQGLAPLVESGVMPFEAAQTLLLIVVRKNRFGAEFEDQIKAMQPPKPKDDGKAAQAQIEMQKLQLEQQKMQIEAQRAQVEEQRMQAVEMGKHQREQQAEANKVGLEQAKLDMQKQLETMKADYAMRLEQMKLKNDANLKMAIAKLDAETKIAVAAMSAQASKDNAKTAAETDVKTTAMQKDQADAEGNPISIAGLESLVKTVNENLEATLAAAKAPRMKTAIRGKDGRIDRVREELVA